MSSFRSIPPPMLPIRSSRVLRASYRFRPRPRPRSDPSIIPLLPRHLSTSAPHLQPASDSPNPILQERKANLGDMVTQLKESVPNLLQQHLPKQLIHPRILLRICPVTHPHLPVVRGYMSYITATSVLQLALGTLVLSPRVKLHISSLQVEEGSFPTGLGNLGTEENVAESLRAPSGAPSGDALHVFDWSARISMHWRTCNDGCVHFGKEADVGEEGRNSRGISRGVTEAEAEAEAEVEVGQKRKIGSGENENGDCGIVAEGGVMRGNVAEETNSGVEQTQTEIGGISGSANLHKSAVSEDPDETECGKMLSGIFVFELSPMCDKIVVHTIENVELIDQNSMEYDDDGSIGRFQVTS